jgi:hypothetical protein
MPCTFGVLLVSMYLYEIDAEDGRRRYASEVPVRMKESFIMFSFTERCNFIRGCIERANYITVSMHTTMVF